MLGPVSTRNLLICFLWVVKNIDQELVSNWWYTLSITRLNSLLNVLDLCVSCFEYRVSSYCIPSHEAEVTLIYSLGILGQAAPDQSAKQRWDNHQRQRYEESALQCHSSWRRLGERETENEKTTGTASGSRYIHVYTMGTLYTYCCYTCHMMVDPLPISAYVHVLN